MYRHRTSGHNIENAEGRGVLRSRDRQEVGTKAANNDALVDDKLGSGQRDRLPLERGFESDRVAFIGVSERLTQRPGAAVVCVGDRDDVGRPVPLSRGSLRERERDHAKGQKGKQAKGASDEMPLNGGVNVLSHNCDLGSEQCFVFMEITYGRGGAVGRVLGVGLGRGVGGGCSLGVGVTDGVKVAVAVAVGVAVNVAVGVGVGLSQIIWTVSILQP